MLLDLPTDLLEEISKALDSADQARLRAVCKVLECATRRLFFSRLVLRTGKHLFRNRQLDLKLLKALAAGKTGWNVHARKIDFVPGPYCPSKKKLSLFRLGREKRRLEAVMLLNSALAKMTHVQAIFWRPGWDDVPSQREVIAAFLGRVPVLDEFGLDITTIGLDAFDVPAVRGVRKFELIGCPWRDISSRHPITSVIRTQDQLTCLNLQGREEWTEVWAALREARIQLTDISTNIVSADLFKYLLSYTGLRKLDFVFQDMGSQEGNNRLADVFYESVLPHHADTLAELSCATEYESQFSFGEHNAHIVAQLCHLTVLEIVVSGTAAQKGCEPGFCPASQSIEAESTDVNLPVNLLLETAASLPKLRHLTISPANAEEHRYICSLCTQFRQQFKVVQSHAIARVVEGFRCVAAKPFEVQVGEDIYGLRRLEGVDRTGISEYHCVKLGRLESQS